MAKLHLLALLFCNGEGENKLQICDFSRCFGGKWQKFSRKCDCIGRNFEPWWGNFLLEFRDVDKIFNRQELPVHRQVYKSPLWQIFETVKDFSAKKIKLTAGYFP